MQEGEEPDTCRICSAPAEPDQPLFHPCKCSGTIRYIHQDCLTTWLAHSKKKTCDVCKHSYSFTKVYAPDMPSHIPPLLLIRRVLQQLFFGLLFVVRAIAVAIIWLAFLPWVTVWTWRMYFAIGESTAWWVSDRPRPPTVDETPSNTTSAAAVSYTLFHKVRFQFAPEYFSKGNIIERITSHPAWVSLSADIFTGQIIAALIVLTFVAVFLLREWITQNARPGLFDDDVGDLVGLEDPVNLPPPPPPVEPALPPLNPPEIEGFPEADLARRQQQAIRVMDAFRLQGQRHPAPLPSLFQHEDLEDEEERRSRRTDEVLKRARFGDGGQEEEDEPPLARVIRPDQKRRARLAAAAAARVKAGVDAAPHNVFGRDQPRFTFTYPLHEASGSGDAQEVKPDTSDPSSFFPSVHIHPPRREEEIPFSLRSWSMGSPTSSTHTVASSSGPPKESPPNTVGSLPDPAMPFAPTWTPSWAMAQPEPLQPSTPSPPPPIASTSASTSTAPPSKLPFLPPFAQRPPLPSSVFPSPGSEHGSGAKSPGLASYRPPEEPLFEPQDYFVQQGLFARPDPRQVPEDPYLRDALKRREQGRREWEAVVADGNSTDSASNGEQEERVGVKRSRNGKGKGKARQTYVDDEDEEASGSETYEFGQEDLDAHTDVGRENHGYVWGGDGDGQEQGLWEWDLGVPGGGGVGSDDDDDAEGQGGEMDRYFRAEEQPNDVLRRMLAEQAENHRRENGFVMPEDQQPVIPMLMNARAHIVDGGPAEDNAGAQVVNGQGGGAGGDLNDDLEGGVEDDMEGAMEAIGMRGPIHGVLQNAALMIFVLDTAIGLCIWIPFTIGKTTALLSLNPPRMLQIIHLPIKGMRLVTDPFVDLVAFLVYRFLIPPLRDVANGSVNLTLLVVQQLLGKKIADSVLEISNNFYDQSKEFLQDPLATLTFLTDSNQTVPPPTPSDHVFPAFAQPLEPHFEALGRHVRLSGEKAQESWIRLALGNGPAERVFAIFLGYVVVSLMLAAYLNVLTVGNARTAGRAVRNAVRQQLLVLKVAAFIFIELVLFPLGCGVILDLCTVWLFPEANLLSRVTFFTQAPLTAVFYHWVAGTIFMYSFAVLLSSCRGVMRPGAMWFIKDPQDQNSHPIRDILERPTFLQLRKILASAVMYAVVVAAVVGSVAGLLLLGSKSIMPFRWKNREALSSVPVDLLFLHLILPQTLHYFRPRRAIKALATRVWRFLATKLRLTSYFFGGRYPEEEYVSDQWRFPWSTPEDESEKQRMDGTFRRVPATDHLALPREMKATAEVTAEGFPVDDENARLMETQNEEARKAKHEVDKDYMVVFIPSGFRYRILGFMALLWTIGALFIGVSVALPVQLGRSFFTLFTAREVHDGYSFIVGFYSLWACYLFGKAVDRLERQHRRLKEAYGNEKPPKDIRILAVKRCLFWITKMAYLGFFLGLVIPILLAFVMDLYVVLPIRSTFNPGGTPRIRVVDNWAVGLLYGKIFMYISRMQPQHHHMVRDIQRVLDHGWIAADPIEATTDVIVPLTAGLLGMILLPALLLQIGRLVLAKVGIDAPLMYLNVYPAIFVVVAVMRLGFLAYDLFSGWSQSIRDTEFLVELRLKNHEPEPPAAQEDGEEGSSQASERNDVERTHTVHGDEALEAAQELHVK